MPAIIETHSLEKTYGQTGALQGLNLSVPQGSICALVGANGAGKTTAIKILLNIIPPTRGYATILGVNTRDVGPGLLGQIGYVSENQVLPGRLRVAQFFDYLRAAYRSWDSRLEQQLRSQLRLPPGRKINALSHGMRMKLRLACALAFRPKLLILDEPFSGLDALAREEMIVGFLREPRDVSILISSHELDEVERLATHVALLDEGRLLFQGSLAKLRQQAQALSDVDMPRNAPLTPTLRAIFVEMVNAARRSCD
jgi:ABC-2 type transport system ATP-binding protein